MDSTGASESNRGRSFPGGRRGMILIGKIRRLIDLRKEYRLPINRDGFALVVAGLLADQGTLSSAALAEICDVARIPRISIGKAKAIADEAFDRQAAARSQDRRAPTISRSLAGRLLELTAVERDELEFWSVSAIDEGDEAATRRRAAERQAKARADRTPNEEKAADRREREAARKRAKRHAKGQKPRAEWLAEQGALKREAEALGISVRTLQRRRKAVAGLSAVAGVSAGGLLGGNRLHPSKPPLERRRLAGGAGRGRPSRPTRSIRIRAAEANQ